MIRRTKKKWVASLGLLSLTLSALYLTRESWIGPLGDLIGLQPKISKENIAQAFAEKGVFGTLPQNLTLDLRGRRYPVSIEYSTHTLLTEEMEKLFSTYRPDYGAFVAMDATTGKILTLISYTQDSGFPTQNLALRASFPSASVFKVVTAAAVIAERKMKAGTIVSFNGRAHTLYKKNIFHETTNRWTTHLTLKEAFAKSINTVFGKLGVFNLGPTELKTYAEKFGFNRRLASDLPVQQGRAEITEDPWEIAETASGFTQQNTMSPLQGALIASTIANDGKLMEPFIVERLRSPEGETVYEGSPHLSEVVIDPESAAEMKILMRETVTSGTSSGSFRGFKRGTFGMVDVGGKTGSLTGKDPEGKYDWFVGYASEGTSRLAFAALVISKEYWKVKSSTLARRAIEVYFGDKYGVKTRVADRRVASKKSRGGRRARR